MALSPQPAGTQLQTLPLLLFRTKTQTKLPLNSSFVQIPGPLPAPMLVYLLVEFLTKLKQGATSTLQTNAWPALIFELKATSSEIAPNLCIPLCDYVSPEVEHPELFNCSDSSRSNECFTNEFIETCAYLDRSV